MKIYALNGMQSHSESVKKNVALVGSVVLRGFKTDNDIQLLEGSHRMAYAIELGLPITIVMFGKDEIIPHDCDDIESSVTGLPDRSTAGELAHALIKERGLYEQAVYESDDCPNIKIIESIDEPGKTVHTRLISCSPFSAFPEKIWTVTFGELKDVIGKNILVLGKNSAAEAFNRLGAYVEQYPETAIIEDKLFDLIYADIHDETDLRELFSTYRKLLKAEGLAVTLNERQTPEIISAAGLEIYAFLKTQEDCPTVSFASQKLHFTRFNSIISLSL